MKRTDELLSSFSESWTEFSDAWKKARSESSEKSIHDLRVSTRRLTATLELTRALSRHKEIPKLQRRFKKVLKSMGRLRDVQVQLEKVSKMRKAGLIADFKETLERRERREIESAGKELKHSTKRRLSKGVKDVRSEFERLHEKRGEDKIRASVERVIKTRSNDFLRARKRFQPSDNETLHEMRIALKKLRYTFEAATPVLGRSADRHLREMQAFQQLLGDTRDLELLSAAIEKWAAKKRKTIAVVPALESLREKREALMPKIIKSAERFKEVFQAGEAKPAVETTQAAAPPTPSPLGRAERLALPREK